MCGIAGIIQTNKAPVSDGIIEAMTSALSHRGPDGCHTKTWGHIGFGHSRLSIIDLETGGQPICNEDGTVWITYNGEVYNYLELRRQLESKGHQFHTKSDTEVIVHSYEEWGDQCVERFRGMFAFAVADFKQQRVFLARDHLGIKPLFFIHTPSCFAFASEIQALRCISGLDLEIDIQGLDQYLWLQYIPAPRTVFKQVHKLAPAHRFSVSFDGTQFGPEEYWQIHFSPVSHRDEGEWLEMLEEVVCESVKAHLVSDVPFGAFLSGGVDSSAVVAYMSRIMTEPVKTFSIGFEEDDFSEVHHAEVVAKKWGTEHHVEIVKPDAMEVLPKLVKHYGEPFGDSSALPTYYVCQMARKHVPMVLSGDGGDETFAGYDSYRTWMENLSRDNVPLWRNIASSIANAVTFKKYASSRRLVKWLKCINYIPSHLRHELWRKEYRSVTGLPLTTFEKEFERTRRYGQVNAVQYMDLKTYLPFDILTKVDVASMLHGLEVRTPFVDVRVVEFAATIPESLNMKRDGSGKWHGKMLLKKAMERYYSLDFVHRPKMGFGVPIQKWFAPSGPLRTAIEERLLGQSSRLSDF
ncbi:MAG TPA: asparagine synthase (glutamine-hydrolyzing), partial [Candidatus Bathyarchaeia archaeon]|nr:asparagine synthase (glutamine-hydrolyzing) [Candidatus Bathyarchaeia archaeon]